MKSMTVTAALALVGLVLVLMPAGSAYAGQTPVAISNTASMTDTVVTNDATLPVHPVHYKKYGTYRGYYGGYPGSYGYYGSYYPRSYYGYYPSYRYYSYPRTCWWYGGVKYCS